SMRVWLDPDRIAGLEMTAADVLQAMRGQNVQIASGTLNQPPVPTQLAFELNVRTQGRLKTPEEFGNIIIKNGEDGRLVRLKDVARIELGAESYSTRGYLGNKPAIALPIFQRPGTNAIKTSEAVSEKMKELARSFPQGLKYEIAYNPTNFVEESIHEVGHTIFEAMILVVLVILIFLQSWRAALIPILAIPVSLVGTFAVMGAIGYSLNNLTLFGMVLAIGIVVDDAIVVVENMELNMEKGLAPKEAARKTMDEVGGALVAMGLVLVAVFLPTMFIKGVSGQFYKQFGVTIAVATMISVGVSLTLSPALAGLLLKPKGHEAEEPLSKKPGWLRPVHAFNRGFNAGLAKFTGKYTAFLKTFLRMGVMAMIVYFGVLLVTGVQFKTVPTGYIPAQDQGYFITVIQLPPGSSLARTDEVIQRSIKKILEVRGVENAVAFAGFDAATFTNASNGAAIFVTLKPFSERHKLKIEHSAILADLNMAMGSEQSAFAVVIAPPPVRGMGTSGGFKMMIQDRRGRGLEVLKDSVMELMMAANQDPALRNVFSFFNTSTPQLYFDIDRVRAEKLGVPVAEVSRALEVFLGSAFVNDFSYLGRSFRVTAQADAPYRLTPDDITRLRVRNKQGQMVPLGSLGVVRNITGPALVAHYNLYPAAALQGDVKPGRSSGEGLEAMERLAKKILPDGISYEWTDVAYQQKQSGNTAGAAFVLAMVFVFLLLAAQFESWTLPLAIVMIVPMCLLPAIAGISLAGMDNSILVQIGLIVLVGLASKNAILIVEFAKQLEDQGMGRYEAALQAAQLRLRPILMTAFSFILGVIPLMFASGAGAEMRRALGTTVFSGMLGVTLFGLVLTPVFYVICRGLGASASALFSKKSG
ncbi:MAG: efflux RND transporter permease subunit, partial [Candidatus Omnitrophica bacterium]|nr:efflux RND transporter permease subunit [Candidatus Omnitrophota bacterium]